MGVQEGLQAAVGVLGQLPLGPACTAPPLLRTPLPSGPCSHPWLLPGHPGLLPASEVHLGLRCARCVCCVQRPLPPALGPLPLLSAPGSVGPVPGVQEGGRTSRPCSPAGAGPAGRPLAGPSPGQEPQPEELSGHPRGAVVGEARPEGGGSEPHPVPALQGPAGAPPPPLQSKFIFSFLLVWHLVKHAAQAWKMGGGRVGQPRPVPTSGGSSWV